MTRRCLSGPRPSPQPFMIASVPHWWARFLASLVRHSVDLPAALVPWVVPCGSGNGPHKSKPGRSCALVAVLRQRPLPVQIMGKGQICRSTTSSTFCSCAAPLVFRTSAPSNFVTFRGEMTRSTLFVSEQWIFWQKTPDHPQTTSV